MSLFSWCANASWREDAGFDLKIPDQLITALIDMGGTAAHEIEQLQKHYRVARRRQQENSRTDIQASIRTIEEALAQKHTKTNETKLRVQQRKLAKLEQQMAAPSVVTGDYRIYPYYFAPVILSRGEGREIVPARYRILPRTGVELPNQYNVFNARRDSPNGSKLAPLFGKQHALFPFLKFFEWVDRGGKNAGLTFNPDGHDGMHAAALYEEYQHPELGVLRSFAMVTDEPPDEVRAAGHDRCPVFLQDDVISHWLPPEEQTLGQLDALLDLKQPTFYSNVLAA